MKKARAPAMKKARAPAMKKARTPAMKKISVTKASFVMKNDQQPSVEDLHLLFRRLQEFDRGELNAHHRQNFNALMYKWRPQWLVGRINMIDPSSPLDCSSPNEDGTCSALPNTLTICDHAACFGTTLQEHSFLGSVANMCGWFWGLSETGLEATLRASAWCVAGSEFSELRWDEFRRGIEIVIFFSQE